jgi:2-amino-4-hydroxy-6-hydroxymethyldihydropteridine diphosphokinase
MRDVAYIALGSNLGDRAGHLRAAREAIAALPDTRVLCLSDVEETDPIGPPGQGVFLNQMVAVETTLPPHALLDALQRIEHARGRTRAERWAARTLDLDIVLLKEQTVSDARLTVPHPQLANRDFWQRQLAEIRVST